MGPSRSAGIPLEAQYLYRQALLTKNNGQKEGGPNEENALKALKYLKMAIMITPRFCNAYNAMGNCLDEMGRYDEAMKAYGKVLELDPEHTEARFKRDMILKKLSSSGKPPEIP